MTPRFIPRIGSRLKPLLFVGVGADGAMGRRIQKGMEMRVPARALKPLVVLAVAAASVGCISPAAYAEDTSVSVTSDSSNHVVVDVDLSACASDSGSDRQGAEKDGQGESVSETEADETMAALWELSAASIIILKALFFFFALPTFLVACLMLVLYELLELHDRHRL